MAYPVLWLRQLGFSRVYAVYCSSFSALYKCIWEHRWNCDNGQTSYIGFRLLMVDLFRSVGRIAKSYYFSFVRSVCLSVLVEELYSHYTDFPDSWYFRIFFFRKSVEKIQVSLKSASTRWRSWLRHCTASRKVAGSIPDGFIEKFHWYNPSGRTTALGSTQSLTEMITRNIYCGVKAAGA